MIYDKTKLNEIKNIVTDLGKKNPSLAIRVLNTHSDLSEKVLLEYAKSKDHHLLLVLAGYSNLPQSVQDILVKSPLQGIRWCLATNPAISKETSLILAKDEYESVRETLAEHTRFIDLINVLSDDCLATVRKVIAKRKNLPDDVIIKLAKDSNIDVKGALLLTYYPQNSLIYQNMSDLLEVQAYIDRQAQEIEELLNINKIPF
jgi:hypothetical protein